MRTFKLRVMETSEVTHIIQVPDDFAPYPPEQINDWVNELSAQDSRPVETHDVQVERILEAEEVAIN